MTAGGAMAAGHGLTDVVDVGAFLVRLTRFDPAALVRLRSGDGRYTVLWGRLPWGVLVARAVGGPGPGDATVRAADLLAEVAGGGLALPGRRDEQWRWPLPPAGGQVVVQTLAVAELRRLADAAAGALRTAAAHGVGGRRVGERVLRDALLDHVALVITEPAGPAPSGPVEVSQRLIQGVSRMGFLGAVGPVDGAAQVRVVGRWVGISAPYGVAWLQSVNQLTVRPIAGHPTG